MGRTRSLRYALRPSGRKYIIHSLIKSHVSSESDGEDDDGDDDDNGGGGGSNGSPSPRRIRRGSRTEMKRTGQVYDQSKLDGAAVFKQYEGMCWDDQLYRAAWARWGGSRLSEISVKGSDWEDTGKGLNDDDDDDKDFHEGGENHYRKRRKGNGKGKGKETGLENVNLKTESEGIARIADVDEKDHIQD